MECAKILNLSHFRAADRAMKYVQYMTGHSSVFLCYKNVPPIITMQYKTSRVHDDIIIIAGPL